MAHNLEIKNGKASFAAFGEKAWHGLGTYIDRPMTAEEVVKLAGMDYEVAKTPILINPDGADKPLAFPGVYATYRTDNNEPLGIVSNRYEIVQNRDAFSFFDPIIDRGEAIYQTAGVLGRGERVFITAKLPEDIEVAGEKVEQYLLITNGHDAMNAVRVGFTPIRVVCNNTLTAALNGLTNSMTIFHYNDPKGRLTDAHRVMGLASKYMQEISGVFEKMADVKVTDTQLRSFLESVFVNRQYVEKTGKPSKQAINLMADVYKFATTHPTQLTPSTQGTLYGAYNAVSGYFGHRKQYSDASRRMQSISFGSAATKTGQAFTLAVEAMDSPIVLDRAPVCN